MKKILIYNGQLFMGGIERVLISYLQGLSKEENLEITLLIKENNPEKNVFFSEIPENIECIFIKTEKSIKFRKKIASKKNNPFYKVFYQILLHWERITMKNWLKDYFQKNSYDAVIDFDMSLGKYMKTISSPKIGWCHYSLAAKIGKKRKRFGERLKNYDNIVVICDDMKNELDEVYPHVKDRGIRIYNPMDIVEIAKKSKIFTEITEDEKKLMEQPYMIGVSRLVKGKGREDLIEVYNELKKRGITEKLYLLGDGPERENLQKKIDDLGLQNQVRLLGQKKNPYPWMKNAELFLHTSYGEGLPTVFIESMICGTAVAAYDCPTGPREILGEGKYGILTPMGDMKKIEEEIYNFLKNPEKKEVYKKYMDERIQEFSRENIILKFKKLLAESGR